MDMKMKMNLFQKLVQVRRKVEFVKKATDGYGGGSKTAKYATTTDLLLHIREELDIQNIFFKVDMESFEHITVPKPAYLVHLKYTWIDGDDTTQRIESKMIMFEDKITGCHGIGSILTYAERYFLYKSFLVATDKDDPAEVYKKLGIKNRHEEEEDKEDETEGQFVEKVERNQAKIVQISDENISTLAGNWKKMLGERAEIGSLIAWLKKGREALKDSPQDLLAWADSMSANKEMLLKEYSTFLKNQGVKI